jgi:release factor glutamine methyltransferase
MTIVAGTIAEVLAQARQLGADRIEAEVLLGHVIARDRTYLYTWPERELAAADCQRFSALLARRLQGEPVAYLTGSREFWSLPLRVEAGTLIPRHDTETLVQAVLELPLPADAAVLDAGTGTGAIVLALGCERARWQLFASDRDFSAARLALRNAVAVGRRVGVLCGDWLVPFAAASFDVIVSNPPYIAADDPHLQQGDLRFEPRSALVAADDGFADLKILISDARRVLKPGGFIALEHGWQQAAGVRALLQQHGYTDIASHRDIGGNERVTLGRLGGRP